MKILVAGSSGLVGSALVPELASAGHTVCRLVRPGRPEEDAAAGFAVAWDPATGELGGAAVGADAVINLAGASIAERPWTAARKELLRTSRVNTTRALVTALAKMNARPRVLISASATGIYGDRGDELLTEESRPGEDFLAGLARDWEAEAVKAEALGIRVVRARFGIILAKLGGALPHMMLPFRFGVGGKLGSGQQWMSWVTREDTVGILQFALDNASVSGAINVVSPQPVRNAEFTQALAKAMHRPSLFTAPAFALRLVLGELADALLLSSQRVAPGVLEKSGFAFRQVDISSALNSLLASK
jgi:uncharacterized protein (TIGR01777 family)